MHCVTRRDRKDVLYTRHDRENHIKCYRTRCIRHTSHVTRHTSHVTRHASHVTRKPPVKMRMMRPPAGGNRRQKPQNKRHFPRAFISTFGRVDSRDIHARHGFFVVAISERMHHAGSGSGGVRVAAAHTWHDSSDGCTSFSVMRRDIPCGASGGRSAAQWRFTCGEAALGRAD